MPVVIRHITTRQLVTDRMKNVYGLMYYGVKHWDTMEEARQEWKEYLLHFIPEVPFEEWELCEISGETLKSGNVKLNNEPSRILFLEEDGRIRLEK
ncbi:MAG: hypothetical protein H0Z33_10795 [Bacillaceae bacterium]|nr:hypothetical protein [Bacillaceae bacterium]